MSASVSGGSSSVSASAVTRRARYVPCSIRMTSPSWTSWLRTVESEADGMPVAIASAAAPHPNSSPPNSGGAGSRRQAQVQPAAVSDQPGGDVEDGQPQPLAAGATPEAAPGCPARGRCWAPARRPASTTSCRRTAAPARGSSRSHSSAPGWCPRRDAAAQPVVRLDRGGTHPLRADVGDDVVQPPVLGVVDGQLVAGGLGLTTHDQPHGASEQGRCGRGDLTALLGRETEQG